MSEKLYNYTAVDRLLGSMILDTTLVKNEKFPLEKSDFVFQIHKILYSTLFNLSQRGVKSATSMDIEEFIRPYASYYQTFIDGGGLEYINTITQLTKVDNYEFYYDSIRKMSLLRDMRDDGDNICKFWD